MSVCCRNKIGHFKVNDVSLSEIFNVGTETIYKSNKFKTTSSSRTELTWYQCNQCVLRVTFASFAVIYYLTRNFSIEIEIRILQISQIEEKIESIVQPLLSFVPDQIHFALKNSDGRHIRPQY